MLAIPGPKGEQARRDPVEASENQEAFQLGIRGLGIAHRLGDAPGTVNGPEPTGGPNEALLLKVGRLPGLTNVRAAYETGRALRMIIRLFDQAGAPESVGRQFIDNLGAAIMADHMRRPDRPWGAADTADMFVEMYTRILGGRKAEHDKVRRMVMDYAVAAARPPARGGGLMAAIRRRAAGSGRG
jgi:hypothetical protein